MAFRLIFPTLISFILLLSPSPSAAEDSDPPLLGVGLGLAGIKDSNQNLYGTVELRGRPLLWVFRPWGCVHFTDEEYFFGAGLAYRRTLAGKVSLAVGSGPGGYLEYGGVDLGHTLQFRSFAECAVILGNGHRIAANLAHYSNGGISPNNPGSETLCLFYAIPWPF